MAERKTYAIFLTDGRWGRTNSIAKAKKAIVEHGGGKIYSLGSGYTNEAMDGPTFRAVGDLVPFTPSKSRVKLYKTSRKSTVPTVRERISGKLPLRSKRK